MKKTRSFALIALATLMGLVSCGSATIDAATAKKRAADISDVQESKDETKFTIPTAITYTDYFSSKSNADQKTTSMEMSNTLVIDVKNYYLHKSVSYKSNNSENSISINIQGDYYAFLEQDGDKVTCYSIMDFGDLFKSNLSATVTRLDMDSFETQAEALYNQATKTISDTSLSTVLDTVEIEYDPTSYSFNATALSSIEEMADNSEDQTIDLSEIGVSGTANLNKLEFKSSGDGSLEAFLDASLDSSMTVSDSTVGTKASYSMSYIFSNYLFSSASIKIESEITSSGMTITSSIEQNTNCSYTAKILKPSNYKAA